MRIIYLFIGILATTLLYSGTKADTTVTSTGLGISAYLPDNWIATQAGDTCILFNDTTFTYRSQIACKKRLRNTTDYPSAGSWTRAHFISYLLVVQFSYDPFGAVLYFDSSAASTQDSLWAPEAFTEFYSLDTTLIAWNEYMRYTETAIYGYEFYAIGDTADMKLNIGTYMGIIRMMQIDVQTNQMAAIKRHFPRQSFTITKTPDANGAFDLLGKRLGAKNNLLNGVYYRPETGRIHLNLK